MVGEIAHNGDRSAATGEYGGAAEHVGEGPGRGLDGGMIGIHHDGRAGAENPKLDTDAGGRVAFEEITKRTQDLVRILIRNQAKAHFGRGFGWNHGFCASARESASD